MPRGVLCWARLMVSTETVIWGGGINPSVLGGHSCIYMHILAIYMHIWHIHAYTCIDLGRVYIHAYMCIYYVTDRVKHICSNTCIYLHILAYMCIYYLPYVARICSKMKCVYARILHVCCDVFASSSSF